jgi:hypothetical protein
LRSFPGSLIAVIFQWFDGGSLAFQPVSRVEFSVEINRGVSAMGRPPIGKKPMTATEYQRRWRQKRRQQGLVEPGGSARAESPPLAATRVRTQPASEQAAERRIEELVRQRDQALAQLELAHRGIRPREAGHDYPNACFICHKRPPEAKGMVTASRRHFQLFLCGDCIYEMRQLSDKIIAGHRV